MNDIFDAIGRRFSMASEGAEDQGPVAEIEVDEAGAPLTAEDTVEGEVIEASEHAEAAEETAVEAETVENTAEALESFLLASVEDRRNGNYWSAQTARNVERGFQAVIQATGGNPNFKVRQLAGENFSDRRDAQSSMISFENAVTDMLKTLWQKLKDMVKKVIRHVRQFFIKHFSAVGMLKKRAEAMRKKAQTQEKAPGKGKVTVSGWSALQIKNAMPEGKEIASGIGVFATFAEELSPKTLSSYGDALEAVADIIDSDKVSDVDAVELVLRAVADQQRQVSGNSALWPDSPPNHAGVDRLSETGQATKELPGGVVAVGVVTDRGLDAYWQSVAPNGSVKLTAADYATVLKDIRFVFVQARDKSKDLDTGKEHKRLSAGEVLTICSKILEFCDSALRHKNSFERYEKQTDKFLAKMDKIASDTRGHDDDDQKTATIRRNLASGVAASLRNMTLWQQSVERRGLSVSRAALDYCNASLNTSNTN